MSEEYDIEIDNSTYSLLDAIVRSSDDPLRLAAVAGIDPDEFRQFLKECNEVENREASQLLKAAEVLKSSSTTPSTISTPAWAARGPVSERQKLTFIVLSKDPHDSKEIRRVLSGTAAASVLMISEDAEQVFSETVRLRPSAVLINLARMDVLGLKFVRRISNECADTVVICASRDPSPGVILGSLRAGARDFLHLPIIEQELMTVIERNVFVQEAEVAEPRKRGRAIAVFSGKGGSGCSVIATNLAMLQPDSTVLVDLNLQTGDLDLFFGLDPKFSLTDVVENRDRLDDELLTNYLSHYSPNVSLLPAPIKIENADEIEPQHVYEILERLRQRFEQVIIDTPHNFDPVTIAALDNADQIVLVLTLEIPAIRSTRRTLEVFDRLGYPREKIRLVVNRWSKNSGLDRRQVEDFLGQTVVGFIPRDDRVVVNSINLGQPAVKLSPSSDFVTEILSIASLLSTADHHQSKTTSASKDLQVQDLLRKPGLFDDFLSRFRPKEST